MKIKGLKRCLYCHLLMIVYILFLITRTRALPFHYYCFLKSFVWFSFDCFLYVFLLSFLSFVWSSFDFFILIICLIYIFFFIWLFFVLYLKIIFWSLFDCFLSYVWPSFFPFFNNLFDPYLTDFPFCFNYLFSFDCFPLPF